MTRALPYKCDMILCITELVGSLKANHIDLRWEAAVTWQLQHILHHGGVAVKVLNSALHSAAIHLSASYG